MNRFNLIDPSTTTGKVQNLLEKLNENPGVISNLALAMANSPVVLESYIEMGKALAQGILSGRIKVKIALLVAQQNHSLYFISLHTAQAKEMGLSNREIINARKAISINLKECAALKFASAMIAYRGNLSDVEFNSIRQAGFSDQEITEIVGQVILHIFVNYFNNLTQPNSNFTAA